MVYLQCIGREEEDTRQPPFTLFIILMTIQQTNKAGKRETTRSQFNVFDYSLANIEIKKSKEVDVIVITYYLLFFY